MKTSHHVVVALFFSASQFAGAQPPQTCGPDLNWTYVADTKVSFSPNNTIVRISRYADALLITQEMGGKTFQYLDHSTGVRLVKPYDLDPMKSFLETDQVAGVPIQILAMKFKNPCDLPEAATLAVTGAFEEKKISYKGHVTRNGQDIQFILDIFSQKQSHLPVHIIGSARFDNHVKPINNFLSLAGWSIVGKRSALPEGTTLGQVIKED